MSASTVELINPLNDPRWDRLLGPDGALGVFQRAPWARVLAEAYGYAPHYAAVIRGSRISALLPVMEVSSRLTGVRGVSLPFSDDCQPLAPEDAALEEMIEVLLAFGESRGWRYLELRGAGFQPSEAVLTHQFLRHDLRLEPTDQMQSEKLSGTHSRNIRRALKEGVQVTAQQSLDAVDAYYKLHCQTRQRLGVPPQPRRFFHLIHKHLISQGGGTVFLARLGASTIAGSIWLQCGQTAMYKFGASDFQFQRTRPNDLLIWHAIAHYRQLGMQTVSLGRTDPEHTGLIRFKRGWGAEERTLPYYRLGIKSPVSPERPAAPGALKGAAAWTLRRLPLPILRAIGGRLYRHIG